VFPSAAEGQRQPLARIVDSGVQPIHTRGGVGIVKLGFQVLGSEPPRHPDSMPEMARTAEELGYDSFTVTDRRTGSERGGVPGTLTSGPA
jgi:hypothetical protein